MLTACRLHICLNEITRTRIASTNTDFEYDGVPGACNGNLVNDRVRTYEWDALNRLVKVYKTPSSPALIGTYTYDALGRRIRKVVTNGGLSGTISNGTVDYLYNTQWQCVEERNGSNAMTRQYVWGLYIDELVYLNLQNAQGPSMSNGHKFPVQDLLYRTAAVFPDDDTVPDEVYDYDAYGNTLIFNAPGTASNWWANNASQTKVTNCEALFTGQHYDPESEIYTYRTRAYSPKLGRFLERDLLEFGYSKLSIFEYVGSAPGRFLDPSGQLVQLAPAGAVVGTGAAASTGVAAGTSTAATTGAAGAGAAATAAPVVVAVGAGVGVGLLIDRYITGRFLREQVYGRIFDPYASQADYSGVIVKVDVVVRIRVPPLKPKTDCDDRPLEGPKPVGEGKDPPPPPRCPPCPPPPPPHIRFDRVPPSARHFPCPGNHTHVYWYETNQVPYPDCTCFHNVREHVECH